MGQLPDWSLYTNRHVQADAAKCTTDVATWLAASAIDHTYPGRYKGSGHRESYVPDYLCLLVSHHTF